MPEGKTHFETALAIEGGGASIPATFAEGSQGLLGLQLPAVLLLHGTASHRNEVGGMFARQAAALACRGISSLRIDFAGCGDSQAPQTTFTIKSQVADAIRAFDWLATNSGIDSKRIGALGFSQGGLIAALLTSERSEVAALVTWSSGDLSAGGADSLFSSAFERQEDPVTVDLGFRSFTFSREWWDQFRAVDIYEALRGFHRPVLAIAGEMDDLVDPSASKGLLNAVRARDTTLVTLANANHVFNVLDDSDQSGEAIRITSDWLQSRLRLVG